MTRRFKWSDLKDSPVFWHRRIPIWLGAQAILGDGVTADYAPRLDLRGDLPAADGRPVLLACCDEIYFQRFAHHLAVSACETNASLHTHVHIYEPSSRCLEDAARLQRGLGNRLTISHEPPGRSPYEKASKFFFASGRFAVAHRILDRNRAPVMAIDVDGIVRRDLRAEMPSLDEWDVGLILRPSQTRVWRKVLACAVLLNPTPAGRLFSARLAAAVERVLRRRPRFHSDQLLLYYLREHYRRHGDELRIVDLGERWANHDFDLDSLIWTAKGHARKLELVRMAAPLPPGALRPDDAPR
ncbi:MAG TPA: hypothetical protein VFG64_11775 [Dongiaceae bacterium]|nr:hypothetical protein [Dongiaceae bacterium]